MYISLTLNLVMPIGDPRDRFFYPTLTLMIDSYFLSQLLKTSGIFIHYASPWLKVKNFPNPEL